jgi:hypothetical protein
MLKKILTNRYLIGGIIVFVILFIVGLYLEFSVSESLFASVALAVVGIVVIWWQDWGF